MLFNINNNINILIAYINDNINVLIAYNYINIIINVCYQLGEGNGPHSSTLAWKIPWTEEPGRLQSRGSLGVGHD